MSADNHHLKQSTPSSSSTSSGEITHIHFLSEHIGALCFNDDYSDVTLVVEDNRIRGHKVILAAQSEYFRALLYGGMRESNQMEIELKGTSLDAFKILLKYIYTGYMTLTTLGEDAILDVLALAHQYSFADLETSISDYLKAILNTGNVCDIYDTATMFQLTSLASVCCSFMDRHAGDIMRHETFLTLSPLALKEMIGRNSFCAAEVDIFRSVCRWIEHNPSCDAKAEILQAIRLPLMNISDLLSVVRPTGLILPDAILDAIQIKTESKDTDLNYRGFMLPDENVAVSRHGASVLQGEPTTGLLDGNVQNYDMERGFTRHPIGDAQSGSQGIVVKLGKPTIVNHVRMLLWDNDNRCYTYYIEVSIDQKSWVRVVDHQNYFCRSWQKLYFPPRVVTYFRIVGVHNTVNRVFHVVSFECMFTSKTFKLDKGLVVPRENVATIQAQAIVVEGVSRNRNALINGDTQNYDWDSGYTCHQLGSGAIVVQLAQPYMIDSCRLLLWNCDDRTYSYYIEVSTDQYKWETVADKTREACRSWQTIYFRRRPVTFIRIVGTHNTANEVFHCVHFECPAQVHADGCPPSPPSVSGTSPVDDSGSAPATTSDSKTTPFAPDNEEVLD